MGLKPLIIGGGIGVLITLAVVLPLVLILPKGEIREGPDLVRATVNEGDVVGIVSDQAGMFLGIPFGQPPIGELRWKRPRDPKPFGDKYWNATYLRPGCDQICDQPASDYSCPKEESEDCLYLNVWVPRKYLVSEYDSDVIDGQHYVVDEKAISQGKLAVVVWFYGGNFRNGAGSCTIYDGRFMAEMGDVIVVTTNYRVAQLGFLAFGTEGEESLGNFGLHDQIKTLEWVQNNIKNFGGDPNKVTIFGQSAGAESIACHMTNPISDKLFTQAILESNPFGLPFRDLADARELGDLFAKNLSCSDLECMRTKSRQELEAAYNATVLAIIDPKIMLVFQPYGPIIDDELVLDQPINLFREGRQQDKPVVMGSTAEEGMIFLAEAFPDPMGIGLYTLLMKAVFREGDDADRIINQYPPCNQTIDPECDNRIILSPAVTDFVFFCPQRLALFNGTTSNQWLYYFNQTWSFGELWELEECTNRVCHAAELAYVFGVVELTDFKYTPEEQKLSDHMIMYWTNFAKYANPNGPYNEGSDELKYWPKFQESQNEYNAMQLNGDGDFLMKSPFTESCAFWDSINPYANVFRKQN